MLGKVLVSKRSLCENEGSMSKRKKENFWCLSTYNQHSGKWKNPVAQWVISIISVLEATQILSLLLTYHQPIHPALKKGGSEKKYADPASLVCSLVLK